jgi:hypothetical protein
MLAGTDAEIYLTNCRENTSIRIKPQQLLCGIFADYNKK